MVNMSVIPLNIPSDASTYDDKDVHSFENFFPHFFCAKDGVLKDVSSKVILWEYAESILQVADGSKHV